MSKLVFFLVLFALFFQKEYATVMILLLMHRSLAR